MIAKLFNTSMIIFHRGMEFVAKWISPRKKKYIELFHPGILWGSDTTYFYFEDKNLSKFCWRGQWTKIYILEYYIYIRGR